MAIECGFSERTSKLSPEVFFDLMFYAVSLSMNISLQHLTSYMESEYGIVIRKQSLDERFTSKTVCFVKTVLTRLIEKQLSEMLFGDDILEEFNNVRIKDSTKFNIPSGLANFYHGTGGHGTTSSAGISIQFEFDLKTGKILDLTINAAVRNDQRDAGETWFNVSNNDLVMRDLGYFSVPVLQKIVENKAFFLSRLQLSTIAYDENGIEIDFKKLHVFMTKNGIERLEKQVFIGRDKLPVRLIISVVPPQVYQKRIRRRQREESKRGCKMKEKTKFLQHFNLFITNADEKKLPAEKVMPLYRMRWQVELMFKTWKSIFSIHGLWKMKVHRYITMLYIRLILIVINLQIINNLQADMSKTGYEGILSLHKMLHTLKNRFSDILNILRSSMEMAIETMDKLYRILSKNHWREKRKNRQNFIENICLFSCKPEK